jgi:hypothetical protein
MSIAYIRHFERMSGWLSRQSLEAIFCGYIDDSHGQTLFWSITDEGDHIPTPVVSVFACGLTFYRFAQ